MKKILIVDDDHGIVKLLAMNLEANGYAVLSAYNEEEGLKTALASKPDIILLDIMMPVMNGLQMLEILRKISTVPVIIVSAFGDPDKVEKARELGIECFLNKPFEMKVLVNTLDVIFQTEKEKTAYSTSKKTGSPLEDIF